MTAMLHAIIGILAMGLVTAQQLDQPPTVKEPVCPCNAFCLPGPQGVAGPPGAAGAPGVGVTGPQGVAGPPGNHGIPGTPGQAVGEKGDTGEEGIAGMPGLPGKPGEDGRSGATGPPGQDNFGEPGRPGEPGVPGSPGRPGLKGQDNFGEPGRPGEPGVPGSRGRPGLKGQPGETGFPGATGAPGLKGNKGDPSVAPPTPPMSAFTVVRTTQLHVTSGFQTITYEREELDSSNDMDHTSGIFTCSIAGYYFFAFNFRAYAGHPVDIRLYHNDSLKARIVLDADPSGISSSSGRHSTKSAGVTLQLQVDDQIKVLAYGETRIWGGDHYAENTFTGFLIRSS